MASKKSYISLNLFGFDELIKEIEAAGGSINGAVDSCMRQSAQIQQKALKEAMLNSNPKSPSAPAEGKKRYESHISELVDRMPAPEIEWEGNTCIARVGYKKGTYDPKNLSDGYKAVFINYGTPRISPREFFKAAKKKAQPKIKKAQEECLNKILGRLTK